MDRPSAVAEVQTGPPLPVPGGVFALPRDGNRSPPRWLLDGRAPVLEVPRRPVRLRDRVRRLSARNEMNLLHAHGSPTNYQYQHGCRCVACRGTKSDYSAAYKADHREERRSYDAAYHQAHQKGRNAYRSAYYQDHRE